MAGGDSREIERKYDVGESTPIPDLLSLAGVATVDPPVVFELEAVYFDTEALALARERITLRRRTGGEDAGWHLKLPLSGDERTELHEPLGSDPLRIPERFRRIVAVHARGRDLEPVVRLRNRRTVHRMRGADDRILALFCDDLVDAERLAPDPLPQSWREWELELVDGTAELLDAAGALFRTGGIVRATSPSKLARALGDRAPRKVGPIAPAGSAGDLLVGALRAYRDEFVRQDPLVREDRTEAVHDMRIAIARLRSTLGGFGSLLGSGRVGSVRTGLGRLAAILGASRDLELMTVRLDALLSAEPREYIVGPIVERIRGELARESAIARSAVRDVLDTDDYFRLLDDLDDLIAHPALTPVAAAPAKAVLPGMVDHRIRSLAQAARAAHRTTARDPHDSALHDVRKAAKRVRYAAELSLPIAPNRARRLARAAKSLQDLLGEHHDSIVARYTLLRLGESAHRDGESTFTYGRLHAMEQARSDRAEAQLDRMLRNLPRSLRGA